MIKKTKIIVLVICCILFLTTISLGSAEESAAIEDEENDIYDFSGMALGGEYSEKSFNNPAIDIKEVSCFKEENGNITATLEVYGEIQDKGSNESASLNLSDMSALLEYTKPNIYYMVQINTSQNIYTVSYINKTCNITKGEYSLSSTPGVEGSETIEVDYEKDDESKISFTFDTGNSNETIKEITGISAYFKFNLTAILQMEGGKGGSNYMSLLDYFVDTAPNPDLSGTFYTVSEGKVGEEINFTANSFGGAPPYSFQWDFGDGNSDTGRKLTYTYDEKGNYTVNLTVTDNNGNKTYYTQQIKIKSSSTSTPDSNDDKEEGEGGDAADNLESNLLIFIGLISLIVIVGVAVLTYIKKR
ncbi:MAG: PKD domain-containing protein [Candidatus Thermoplasmatota archaeon]